VGSSDNCAESIITINSAVAEQLAAFKREVDALRNKGVKKERAIYETLKKLIKYCRAIHFDGNGYSEEWRAEAERRGLDCETSAPLMFDRFLDKASEQMFAQAGVYSKTELEARTEVKWETYTKKIQIEARVLGDITLSSILPVASKYESVLLDKAVKLKSLGLDSSADVKLVKEIQEHASELHRLVDDMIEARKVANRIDSERERAIQYHNTVAPYFEPIRQHIDRLEEVIDDELWPMPKYRELLFVK
jgi:glutamine synthetase